MARTGETSYRKIVTTVAAFIRTNPDHYPHCARIADLIERDPRAYFPDCGAPEYTEEFKLEFPLTQLRETFCIESWKPCAVGGWQRADKVLFPVPKNAREEALILAHLFVYGRAYHSLEELQSCRTRPRRVERHKCLRARLTPLVRP